MNLVVSEFRAQGYRSLKSIAYPMSGLDIFLGANGVGKTNLYRTLELLRSAAANTLAHDLANEGGLDSALWAGPRRRGEPARIRLAVGFADPTGRRPDATSLLYEIEVGRPPPLAAAFMNEAEVKAETVTFLGGSRPVRLVHRDGPHVMARGEDGRPTTIDIDLLASETVLGRLEDPSRYPELDRLRRSFCSGALIMACEPTPRRRCVGPAWRWRRRRSPPMARISPPCSPRSPIFVRIRRIWTPRSTTLSRVRASLFRLRIVWRALA